MEEPRQVPELVHVLRHSFRPSEQLGRALELFVPLESRRLQSSPEIKSLAMLALDGYSHANHAYTTDLIKARKAIENSPMRSFEITPDIDIRNINENNIDILLGVQNKLALYTLTRLTKNIFKTEASSGRDPADPMFSVFVRINSSVPITPEFQQEALEQYSQIYQQLAPKHLMSIHTQGVIGNDQWLAMKRINMLDDST